MVTLSDFASDYLYNRRAIKLHEGKMPLGNKYKRLMM